MNLPDYMDGADRPLWAVPALLAALIALVCVGASL